VTRRRALRLSLVALLCLLLGAATTVGVAWGLSCRSAGNRARIWYANPERAGPEGTGVLRASCRHRFGEFRWLSEATSTGFASVAGRKQGNDPSIERLTPSAVRPLLLPWTYGLEPWPVADETVLISVRGFGWPLPALASVHRYQSAQPGWRTAISTYGALLDRLDVPSHVLWPGFATNTVLTGFVWSLVMVVAPLRRALRVRRSRCTNCAYDLRGSPGGVCSECGHAAGAKP
jgi:hypothetical protein